MPPKRDTAVLSPLGKCKPHDDFRSQTEMAGRDKLHPRFSHDRISLHLPALVLVSFANAVLLECRWCPCGEVGTALSFSVKKKEHSYSWIDEGYACDAIPSL